MERFKKIIQEKVVNKSQNTQNSNIQNTEENKDGGVQVQKDPKKETKMKLLVQCMAAQKQLKSTATLFSPDSQLTPNNNEEEKEKDLNDKEKEEEDKEPVEDVYEKQILSIYNTNLNFPLSDISVEEFYEQIDIAFLIDATESMTPHFEVVSEYIFNVVTTIRLSYRNLPVNIAVVAYKDNSELINKLDILQFTQNPKDLREFLYDLMLQGGDDQCEDLNGGIQAAMNLQWGNEKSKKFLFQLGDSPCHNTKYNGGSIDDKYTEGLEQDLLYEALFLQLQKRYINFIIVQITYKTDYMNLIFNYIWLQVADKLFTDLYSNNKFYQQLYNNNKVYPISIRFNGISQQAIANRKKDKSLSDDIDKTFFQLNQNLKNNIKILINNIYEMDKEEQQKKEEQERLEKLKKLKKKTLLIVAANKMKNDNEAQENQQEANKQNIKISDNDNKEPINNDLKNKDALLQLLVQKEKKN